MKTLKRVEITPVFVEEFIPAKEDMNEFEIYISKEYMTASHLCFCGCKELTVTPLGKGEWQLTEENGKVTLSPSIGNYQLPCKSHYIIVKNGANFV